MKLKALIELLDAKVQLSDYLDHLISLHQDWENIKLEAIEKLDYLVKEEDKEYLKSLFSHSLISNENVTAIFCSRYKGQDFIIFSGLYFKTIREFFKYCLNHLDQEAIYEVLGSGYFKEYALNSKQKSVMDNYILSISQLLHHTYGKEGADKLKNYIEECLRLPIQPDNTKIKRQDSESIWNQTKTNQKFEQTNIKKEFVNKARDKTVKEIGVKATDSLLLEAGDDPELDKLIQRFKNEDLEILFKEFNEKRKQLFNESFLKGVLNQEIHSQVYEFLIHQTKDISVSVYGLLSFELYTLKYQSKIEETHFIYEGQIWKSLIEFANKKCENGIINNDFTDFINLVFQFYYHRKGYIWSLLYNYILKENNRKFVCKDGQDNLLVLDFDSFLPCLADNRYKIKKIISLLIDPENKQFLAWVLSYLSSDKVMQCDEDKEQLSTFLKTKPFKIVDSATFFIILEGIYGAEQHDFLLSLLFASSDYSLEYWLICNLANYSTTFLEDEAQIKNIRMVKNAIEKTSFKNALNQITPFRADFVWFKERIAENLYQYHIGSNNVAILPLNTDGFCLKSEPFTPIGYYHENNSNALPEKHLEEENEEFKKGIEETTKWIINNENELEKIREKSKNRVFIKLFDMLLTVMIACMLVVFGQRTALQYILTFTLCARALFLLIASIMQLKNISSLIVYGKEVLTNFAQKFPQKYEMVHKAILGSLPINIEMQDYLIRSELKQIIANIHFYLSLPLEPLKQPEKISEELKKEKNINFIFQLVNYLVYALGVLVLTQLLHIQGMICIVIVVLSFLLYVDLFKKEYILSLSTILSIIFIILIATDEIIRIALLERWAVGVYALAFTGTFLIYEFIRFKIKF